MSLLRKQDYFTRIKEQDLDVILEEIGQLTAFSPTQIRQDAEKKVEAKMSSMICHRYDVDLIFIDILTWTATTQFNINDLVEYGEPAYSDTTTYLVNDLVSFETTTSGVLSDDIYKNIIAVVTPEPFNVDKWSKQGQNNALYVVREPVITTKPAVDFVYTTNLFTGDHDSILGWDTTKDIFLKRDAEQVKIYYSAADRTNSVDSIGVVDVNNQIKTFPTILPIEIGDDLENTLSGNLTIIGFMPDLSEWSVVASNPYQKEDNRHRIIIDIMVDLVLFHLHAIINPRFIPDLRGDAKEDAMEWLNDIKKGIITPKLPLFADETKGQRIAFGSEQSLNHNHFSRTRRAITENKRRWDY